jgi:hypothetical protein
MYENEETTAQIEEDDVAVSMYKYTIFDADPSSNSGTAWWDHQDIAFESYSDDTAAEHALDILEREGRKCIAYSPDDYSPGDRIHALVWHEDGGLVATLSYEI